MIDERAAIRPYNDIYPKIADSAYIGPNVTIIGDVTIGAETNIWPGSVIRGDVMPITIGERTNIQDGTVIHVTRKTGSTHVGSGITIGHMVLLHACTVEDDCFIGMRSTVMDGAVVESGGMLAAGSLLTPGKCLKGKELWAGSPAKYFRDMTKDEIDWIPGSAAHYVRLSKTHSGNAAVSR